MNGIIRVLWLLPAAALFGCREGEPAGPITFHRHVAPILFAHCAPCHRPGQSAPFFLLSYADAQKRARQIVEVTARRYMPPWLPDGPRAEFVGDRGLSEQQIDLLRRWIELHLREVLRIDPNDPTARDMLRKLGAQR